MTAEELKRIFGRAVPEGGELQEIRLRAGKPVLVFMDGQEYAVGRRGLFEMEGLQSGRRTFRKAVLRPEAEDGTDQEARSPVLADQALIREILGIFSRHSLYAFEDEIRQGFLTIEGGHRVGIAGKAVAGENGLRTIKDISSLNIRLAHEKPGCGDPVLPWLYENGQLRNTLILSPPGAGKTTLLRDVVRQVSNGNQYGPGLQTAVVDERSELGACFKGVPQCDLGMRTDVMDGCPKGQGMVLMIRSMAPGVVAVDEIGDREDLEALKYVMKCGCRILATVHGGSPEDLKKKPVLAEMVREEMFSRYVVLSRRRGPGTVEAICDGGLRLLARAGCRDKGGGLETEGKTEVLGV